jgi:hypothetical protein
VLPVLATALATLSGLVSLIRPPPPPPALLPSTAPVVAPAPRTVRPRVFHPRKPPPEPLERWRPLLEELGMDPAEWLPRIHCESRGNPGAVNPSGPYVGLAQVENGSTDPRTNLEQAREKMRRQGRRAWPNCP